MNIKFHSAICIALLFFISCGTSDKKAAYQDNRFPKSYNGKAVITGIVDSKNSSGGDNRGYVDIYFNFIPSDRSAPKSYLCAKYPDNNIKLFYDNRDTFHKNWVNKWEIKPGNEYPAIRHESLNKDNTPPVSHEVFLEPKK